ncbi:dsDNA nuclease domain-containing protein [Bacillus toyonensis]|uniref:dsDNA nuclease domain-containing protein n=1 Tax=Bacillus toyonensis TaxID=155322 RepID=UPI003D21E622
MIDSSVIQKVLSISDDRSGDHAQDGFDFQASTAIYLMFDELKQGKEFSLVYEKIDDFIMFVDNIRIYQSKSTSKGLTDTELSRGEDPTKKNKGAKKSGTTTKNRQTKQPQTKTGLSIIEKLQNNMDSIKNNVSSADVKAHLLWNKDYKFGASLLRGTSLNTDLTNLMMSDVSDSVKQKIIEKTGVSKYDWSKIEVIRLLSKEHHEVFTCNHIEDTIYGLIGSNTSYSKAFYASLLNKIRITRKTKEPITSEFLMNEINGLRIIPIVPKPNEYQHLLTEDDYKNYLIHTNVREVFAIQSVKSNPIQKALAQIEDYISKNYTRILHPCNLYDDLEQLPEFNDLLVLYSEEKIKALIINAYLNKER